MIKKLLLGTTLLTLTLAALTATAQTQPSPPQSVVTSEPQPPAPPPTVEERYLILTDTSYGMRKLAKPSRQAVFDIIHWGADGHMVTGDTYGLWTFNEDAYPGTFPMQVWNPDHKLTLASRASLHLADQPYENKAGMNAVMLKLLAIVLKVEDVNFFVITDGSSPLVGLPFEKELEAACAEREETRKEAKKPFIISLIARGGQMTDWSVVIPGEPLILPARRPRPVEIAKVVAPPEPEAPPKGKLLSLRSVPPKRAERPAASPGATPLIITPASSPGKPAKTVPPAPTQPEPVAPVPAPAQPPVVAQPQAVAQAVPVPAPTPAAPTILPLTTPPGPTPTPTHSEPAAGTITVAAREPAPNRASPSSPAMQAAAIPTQQPILTAAQLFCIGGILLVTAIAIGLAFIRRLHPVPQPSYITQSMENHSCEGKA